MRYAGLIKNDIAAAPGNCVTFFSQGCPHKCPGCHNPETWDFEGGEEFTNQILEEIFEAIAANGIQRNFCVMGGEPLAEENEFLTYLVIHNVKEKFPNIKIYLQTGYTYEELQTANRYRIEQILSEIDYLIDGPYIQELRNTTLPMRGSSNQRIIELH